MSYTQIIEYLKQNLSREKFFHSLGTADYAKKLAKKYGLDEEKAYLAGLLHDVAKAQKHADKTLHAPAGAELAREKFGVTDEEILDSIRHHTLGRPDMTAFEKIIFIADKIEPNTRDKEFTQKIEAILEHENGLDKALFECYKATIVSLAQRGLYIREKTIETYNYFYDIIQQ